MHNILKEAFKGIISGNILINKLVIESLRACLIVIAAVVKGKEIDITDYLNRAEKFGKKYLEKKGCCRERRQEQEGRRSHGCDEPRANAGHRRPPREMRSKWDEPSEGSNGGRTRLEDGDESTRVDLARRVRDSVTVGIR